MMNQPRPDSESRTTWPRSPDFLQGVEWVRQSLGSFASIASARQSLARFLKRHGTEPLPLPKRKDPKLERFSTRDPRYRPGPPGIVLREIWLELRDRGLKPSEIAHLFNREPGTVYAGLRQARALREASRRLKA
jgi:hypothetical protein